jgi:hypothetical protein
MKTKQQKRLDAIKYMTTAKNYSLKAVAKRFNMPYSTVWNIHDKLKNTYKPVNTSDTTPPELPTNVTYGVAQRESYGESLPMMVDESKPRLRREPSPSLERALRLVSDGSTADYYELPKNAKELQDLISHKNMNAQIGEIFRACYRYGEVAHSKMLRDAKKIKYYAEAEIKRLENLQ